MIPFTKYHGTGNDFVMIDDRSATFDIENTVLIEEMCSRRFGIGADGLILLRNAEGYDFEMIYFNADGNQSTMCGNGGRCIVQFAHSLGVFETECTFIAIDGAHEAKIVGDHQIKLKMVPVEQIHSDGEALVLDTGSPHYVSIVESIDAIDVKLEGSRVRYSDQYAREGINVNFIELGDGNIKVATYERGVEDETYSCGTGVTAAALAVQKIASKRFQSPVHIKTKGGELRVYFSKGEDKAYSDIWLEGPVTKTFEGKWVR